MRDEREDILWLRKAAGEYMRGVRELLKGIPQACCTTDKFEEDIALLPVRPSFADMTPAAEHYQFPNYGSPVGSTDPEIVFYYFANFIDSALIRPGPDTVQTVFWRVPPETSCTHDFDTLRYIHSIYCRFSVLRKEKT